MQLTATFNSDTQEVTFNNGAVLPVNPLHNWPFSSDEILEEGIHFYITQTHVATERKVAITYQVDRVDTINLHPVLVDEYDLPTTAHLYQQQFN